MAVANAQHLARQWAAAVGLPQAPRKLDRPTGRTRSVWGGGAGPRITLDIVHGLGHGVPLSTLGADGLGRTAPFMIEAGLSSTLEIARAWGLERARSAFRPAQLPRPPGLLARLSRLLGRLVGKLRSPE